MVERTIQISKEIISILTSFKSNSIDQISLNKSLLKKTSELLTLQAKDITLDYNMLISDKQMLETVTSKIKKERLSNTILDEISVIFNKNDYENEKEKENFSFLIENDLVSTYSSITKNFNLLKTEKKHDSTKEFSEKILNSIEDFDTLSINSKNQSCILNETHSHLNTLTKEVILPFGKKYDKRILLRLEMIYNKLLSISKYNHDNKNCKIMFIVIFKQMILHIGFSLKKFYADSVRRITMNISFSTFVSCFLSIFNLESQYSFYKYKCK